MSSSASSSRSSSPDSDAPLSKAKSTSKSKTATGSKGKGKGKKRTLADDSRNEGEDPNWAYQPPEGATLLENPKDLGEFDWDALEADENLDVWVIRVPDSLKIKHLENVSIQLPAEGITSRVGQIAKKNDIFDIWTVGNEDGNEIGGEEVTRLACALPRTSKKGEMQMAPRSISRRLVISAAPPSISQTAEPYRNPPRPTYPQEALKHAFKPYGAGLGEAQVDTAEPEPEAMEVDVEPVAKSKAEKPKSKGDKKSKKRKDKDDDLEDVPPAKKTKKTKH